MKTLILKEKKILLSDIILVGFSIFFASLIYIGLLEFNFHSILIYFSISATNLLLLAASMNYEKTFKSEYLLNSLPINKKDIILARYIVTIIFTIIITLFFVFNVLIMGSILLGANMMFRLIDIKDIIIAISLVLILASFTIPLYYSKFSKVINTIFLIPMGLLLGSYLNINIGEFIFLLKKPLGLIILLVAALLLYYFSYGLSKKIYINKEF